MRARQLLFVTVVLGAVLAVGSGTVAGTTDLDCTEFGSTVVGDIDGEWVRDEQPLHEGSQFDLAYCNDDTKNTNDWLDSGDGFVISDSTDDGVYTVILTGDGSEPISFADHVSFAGDDPDGMTAAVVTSGSDEDELERIDDPRAEEYRETRGTLANTTRELDETTTALENGETNLTAAQGDLDALNETYWNMTEQESTLTASLLQDAEAGNASGAIGALTAVQADANTQRDATEATLERYRAVVDAERAEATSTVRLAALGTIAAGLVVGGAVGAAVPLVAARRVEEAMKLSRNVTYDRKTALVPILVGVALMIAGCAILITTGNGVELLEVLR